MLLLKCIYESVNSLHGEDLGHDRVRLHALDKLHLAQLVVLVHVTEREHLSHRLGHVDIACVHAELDEEGHHVEELVNTDVSIAIFIKQLEHLRD